MRRNKIIILILFLYLCLPLYTYAEVKIDDVTTPKDIFYRLGTSDTPENKVDITGKIDVSPVIVKEDKFYRFKH